MEDFTDNTQVPWQFDWKCPKLFQTVPPSNRNVTTATRSTTGSCHSALHPMDEERISNSHTVQVISAQLTAQESHMFINNTDVVCTSEMDDFDKASGVQSIKGSDGRHPERRKSSRMDDDDTEAKMMKWEELESSSEEGDCSVMEEEDQSYYVSITLLSSSKPDAQKTSISGPNQANLSSSNIHHPADSVLIEIYRDCSSDCGNLNLQDTNGIDGLQAIDNLVSRTLLYWPTFTFTNQSNDKKESEEAQQQQIDKSASTDLKTPMNDVANFFTSVQSNLQGVFKRKDVDRNKDGLISATMYRRQSSTLESERQVDIDDAMEVLNRMSLNVYFGDYDEASASASSQHTTGKKQSSETLEGKLSETDSNNEIGELYFCCLSKHGYLHTFTLADLLCESSNSKKEEERTAGTKQGEFETLFAQDFERFLFGQSLHNRVKKTILPLSQPKKSLKLSLSWSGLQADGKDVDGGRIQEPIATEGLQFLDAYSLDANIEHSTIHNRTFNNVPSVCMTAFDFVIVAGKGAKYTQRQHSTGSSRDLKQDKLLRENADGPSMHSSIADLSDNISIIETSDLVLQDTREEWNDTLSSNNPYKKIINSFGHESLPVLNGNERFENTETPRSEIRNNTENTSGGFVTFISMNHFSEAKTIFLPFCPKSISSVVWDAIPILLVMGKDVNQCIAIRTNSSLSSSSSFSAKRIHEKKIKSWKKFTILPIVVSNHARTLIDGPHDIPIPISASLSWPSPPILVYSESAEGIILKRYTLNNLEEIDYVRESSTNSSIEMRLTTNHDPEHFAIIPQPTGIESQPKDGKLLSIGEGQGWSLLSLVCFDKMEVYFVCWEGVTGSNGGFVKKLFSIPSVHLHASNVMSLDVGVRNSDIKTDLINENEVEHISLRTHEIVNVIDSGISSALPKTLFERHQNSAQSNKLIESNSEIERHSTVVTLTIDGVNVALTLRKNAITNRKGSSFQRVLLWMCENEEYVSAAIIGLTLLKDFKALDDLNRTQESGAYIASLLDGILPLDETVVQRRNTESIRSLLLVEPLSFAEIKTLLADMTIACLVKSGIRASPALEGFVVRSKVYNSTRASLVLLSRATEIISEVKNRWDDQLIYSQDLEEDGHLAKELWPIKSILSLAVARQCMPKALLLLNSTIADEMRGRYPSHDESMAKPSFELCKAINRMIIASSETAAAILLTLIDEKTLQSYWQSLNHEVRTVLCILRVKGQYLFLKEGEVREWTRQFITTEQSRGNDELLVSSEWLRELCVGCLKNAGCNLHAKSRSHDIEGAADFESDVLSDLYDGLHVVNNILTTAKGMGGIDFGLLVPALLVLQERTENWAEDTSITTQSMLNAVCNLAGRYNSEETLFAFDCSSVLQQCAKLENVLAAANLIGGYRGLVLKCADILTTYGGLNMNEAERYLFGNPVIFDLKVNDRQFRTADVTDGHRTLLWLIQEHVLSIETYGHFDDSNYRGAIDPIDACRTLLRTWLYLAKFKYPRSGAWLEHWLNEKFKSSIANSALPKAAFVRTILWSKSIIKSNSEEDFKTLAESLFTSSFLIALTSEACGFMESIPSSVSSKIKNERKSISHQLRPVDSILK